MNTSALLTADKVSTDLVTPGLLGFVIVALIGGVLYFLMKSMTAKLDHVRGPNWNASTETDTRETNDTDS